MYKLLSDLDRLAIIGLELQLADAAIGYGNVVADLAEVFAWMSFPSGPGWQ